MSEVIEVDLRANRDSVVAYLRQQLIGPIGGAHEELEGSPLDRYLLGVLYPQCSDADDVQSEEEGEASVAGDEDAGLESPISMAFERLPASMGLSFYLEGTDCIECRVSGGAYALVQKDGARERWKREPLLNSA